MVTVLSPTLVAEICLVAYWCQERHCRQLHKINCETQEMDRYILFVWHGLFLCIIHVIIDLFACYGLKF